MAEVLEKAFEPRKVEPKWLQRWAEDKLFVADPQSDKPKFSVVLPPPNITGELHLGHALNGTVQDILCRYKRMQGFEVLWLPGTDHAAIAAQNVLERKLAEEGKSKEDLGRSAFLDYANEWYRTVGGTIESQLQELGASLDWSRKRFTMDPEYVRCVRLVFCKLYEKGLIYKGKRLVNWCPRCKSAISDLEVAYRDAKDTLYMIGYPIVDGGEIVIATVRPETFFADVAVAVNPKDKRYEGVIGKQARLPLVGRVIPIIADDAVEMDFGTGALKITPGHDMLDYEIGKRHRLEEISVIDLDGNMVLPEFPELNGITAASAREKVVEILRNKGYIRGEIPFEHSVGTCDRCGTVIEPLLSDQWWLSMQSLASPAIEAVEQGKIRFYDPKWTKVYLDWMKNLRDWCISRQIWLGHRIPVYYCENGHTFVSVDEPQSCQLCGSTNIVQDEDVLDTWFSSALWPFATMGWPNHTPELESFYPTDVLCTAREIIFLWVSRMIMMGLEFMGDIPFRDVLVHAVVQDPQGRRMSKSKGNVVDPRVMMSKYGTDALRAWCAAVAMSSQDLRFDESKIEGFRRFANKLWNATRLIISQDPPTIVNKPIPYALEDKWIVSKFQNLVIRVTTAIESYEFQNGIDEIVDFVWHLYCDWYLEAIKPRLAVEYAGREQALSCAVYVLGGCLKLLHPYMPFVTEELWDKLTRGEGLYLIQEDWPKYDQEYVDPDAEEKFGQVMQLVSQIRSYKKALGHSDNVEGEVSVDRELGIVHEELNRLLKTLSKVQLKKDIVGDEIKVGDLTAYLSLDKEVTAERQMQALARELSKVEREIAQLRNMLNRPMFLEKAPSEVVKKVTVRLQELEESYSELRKKISEENG